MENSIRTPDTIISNYPFIPFGELNLCWSDGVAYQRDVSKSVEYAEEYFHKYISYEDTQIAKKINQGRTAITAKYCKTLLDVGVGSGEFIKKSKIKVYGYDINPLAIEWLKKRNIYHDPYTETSENIQGYTFWDSLEHIPNPGLLLCRIPNNAYIFVSIPIYQNLLKVRESRHYRPNEHYYHFTHEGFVYWMAERSFFVKEVSDFECRSGREDIFTYVFQRQS